MKKTHLFSAFLLLCIALASVLSSCKNADVAARDRLATLLSLYGDAPAGAVYATVPREGDESLNGRLVTALYTRADGYLEYDGRVADAAVYLGSAADPFFEAAVFVCYGNADTRAVCEMCMRRARMIAAAHAIGEGDAVVAVSGRTVVCIITRDPAAAQAVLDKLL